MGDKKSHSVKKVGLDEETFQNLMKLKVKLNVPSAFYWWSTIYNNIQALLADLKSYTFNVLN